ncbi:MAG: hypothetical protein WCA35_31135, partial [Kovacikia sp.]
WLGGTAAILGSLMTIGSLLLWIVPAPQTRDRKVGDPASQVGPKPWQNRLKVTAFAGAIALAGIGLLMAFPFPQN